MSIEIKELIIKVKVEEASKKTSDINIKSLKSDIIKEVRKEVRKEIKKIDER